MGGKRRRPRLSLDLLKGFEAAARHISFTQAAQELSLTQSAVSREIKTLEDQLGQRLFTRINRGLRLTDAGQLLYRAVGAALTLIDEATDRLVALEEAERLTVTTSVPLASMWLVPKLWRFVRLHPEVDVRSVAAEQNRLQVPNRIRGRRVLRGGPPLIQVNLEKIYSHYFTSLTWRFSDVRAHHNNRDPLAGYRRGCPGRHQFSNCWKI
jgi:DNA-binding transcriptional LysR family regulator